MKKALKKTESKCYYFKDGLKVEGVHGEIYGNVSVISGNVSGIYGNVSEIYGNVSGIYGNVSGIYGDVGGIYGDVSGISGDVGDCEITKEDRERGVNIQDLIDNN